MPRLRHGFTARHVLFRADEVCLWKRRKKWKDIGMMKMYWLVFLMTVFTTVNIFAASYTSGDFKYSYDLTTKEGTITSYIGSSSSISIPTSFTVAETYKDEDDGEMHTRHHTITVTGIGSSVFANKTFITSVSFHNKLKSIGSLAFKGCTALTSFNPPSSLKVLDSQAFSNCTGLESVEIDGDNLRVGKSVFAGCTSLRSVVYGEGVSTIEGGIIPASSSLASPSHSFAGCSSIESIVVRSPVVRSIPAYFCSASSLTTLSFAGVITNIGQYALSECSGLERINATLRPVAIGYNAFSGCENLDPSVDFSDCTSIGSLAFSGCRSMTGTISLPRLATVSSRVFDGCTAVSGVTLDAAVTIDSSAFYNCTSLASVSLPVTLKTIGSWAFYNCTSLASLSLPTSLTTIGSYAFRNCTAMKTLRMPLSLKVLDSQAFSNCTGLESVEIDGDNLRVGKSVFAGCTSLRSVVYGEGVSTIEGGIIPASSSLASPSHSFAGCSSIESIVVRSPVVRSIPAYFCSASSLTTLSFAGVITNIGQYALSECSGLERINATIKPVSIGNSAFSGCASLIGPVDLSRCTYLGYSAFYRCKSLVGPVNLNKLNTIPSSAFYGCSSLSEISLKGVANIEMSAFQDCTSLVEISLQGVENVQNQSFYGCSSLLKITNIDSLTNIGGRAFAYCTSLTNAFFEWIPPITVASDAFYNINTNCYGFYLDKYETEWDAVIDENGKWHGLIMRHMENDQCCKVWFDPNGGNISAADATKTVIKNSTIGKLPTATMDGHMLEGWYTLPTGGVRVTESTLVVDDMTCYANWFQSTNTVPPEEDEKWSYTVRFHPNGDKEPFYPVIGTVPDQQFYFDEEKALNLNCYSRTGFKFGGWVKNPNKKYVNDYPDGKVVKNIAQKDGDVVDLYALWIPSTVKITFDYNFSLNDFGIIERYYTVGRKFGRLPFFAGSTRAKWLGWFTNPVGGAEVDMAETWVPTSPTTYYGHWQIYDRPLPEPPPVEEPPEGYYIVLFDANGGTINPVDQAIIVAAGEPIGEFPAVTRDGYDFDGWYTAANGGMRIAESTLVTANMTCYAHWRELPVAPVPDPGYGYIRNVTAKQRYPWNGKVDIRFEVVGDVTAIKPGAVPVLAVSATNTVSGETWDAESLTGDTGTEEGWHEILWDLDAQGLDIYSSDIVFTVGYRGNVQTNGSSPGKYCVIDLSGGANATTYPVSYLDSEPTGGWTDEYKTAKLVLRRIDPGTFMMGDISASKAVEVALTKPFYMGVFEVTQKQYGLVTGQNPSSIKGNGMPVDRVSWQAIRGNNNWPDVKTVTASSFVGLIQTKTGLKFDLPTEAQWEYACRAGTATSYYWGDSMDGDYAWYWDNSTNLIHEAGTKRPNAWGLYDMIGNVNEWCLDWYQDKLPGGENPEGYTSGRGRAVRGGNGTNFAYTCTSSYRSFSSPMPALGYYGFRLSRTLSDAEIADASTIPGGAQEEGESSGLLCTGASPRTPIDMRDEPEVESARIVHDSRWIGGNPGAAVLVTDNDEEVRWVAGKGEFTWVPATAGRHVLKYLTYIDGVLQEEIYTAIFRCGNPPEDDPVVGVVSSRVTSVSVKPRWPWNGLVDIDYTLAVEPAEGKTAISVSGYDTVTKTVLAPVTISGVGADGEPVPSGTHRITWDVGADYPEFHSEAFTVDVSTVTPGAPTEIANVSTAAGTNCVSANGQYMVIDLSGGTNAVSYPVSWLDAVPTGGMTSNYVRVDVRSGIGRYLASGVELLGRPDGAYVSEWDTRGETDGWRPVVSDNAESPSVCVLNTTAIVHGGRIGSDETWRSDHVHVVRSNIVVPDGVRLVLDMDAIVKFAPGAKIATEGTGVLLVNGARCADIADDSVGGDTNMDMDGADGGLSPSTTVADWFEENVRPFSVRFGSIGDVIEDCVLKRFYTSGIPLGTLPEPKVPGNKVFDCWCVEDSATPVDGNYEVVSSMVLLPRYSASYYWLEISATEGGSTSRSSGLVEAETRIVVIAEPAFGYRFVRWEGDVSESQAYSSQIAVLMDRARSLRAVFERIPITIGEAVNAPQLSWYTEGDAEWFGEWSRMASDGKHAARSGGIGDSKETVLGLRVSGTGVLSFDWKSSCEERYDAVRLEIDGTQTRVLSGESSWASVRIELGFGDHDIRWVYKKGRSNSSGEDAVWVDNVAWTAAATPTLREALGDFDWESEGEIKWRAMRSEYAYEGDSFAIAEGLGDYGASVIRTTVSGAGRIVFRWAVSCEEGYDWFDFLADGEVVEMTTGETGWKTVSVDLGEGEHELEWVYWKDEIDDPELVGANCAMLDYVQWFPSGEEPPTIGGETLDAFFEWLKSNKQIGAAATRQEAMDLFFAGTAAAGKNVALYDEFLAGTDPKDPASGFKAIIDIKDGKPVVSPSPDLGDARRYTIYGKKDIGDTSEAWIRVEEGGESQFRFFKVTVDMP